MASKALPSQEVLRQLLDHDPSTGALTWLWRGREWFKTNRQFAVWNARYAGKPAFTCQTDGYRTGSIDYKNYKAHRVIWKMVTGEDPNEIDHINGTRSDNRLENLRSVTQTENARNRRLSSNNKTGFHGVHRWAHGRWVYWVVTVPQKKSAYFKCIGQAVRARKAAEREAGFHENHGRAA